MKTVMVLIHDDVCQEARLQSALDVVRAVEGHLVCLDVVQMPVIADGFGVGGGAGVLLMDEREREDSNVERLEPRLANEGVSYEWARVHGQSDVAITDSIRLVDLIVVGKQGLGEIAESGNAAARLAELTSAPILLVPTDQKRLDLFGKVLVAWDGSAPADAAIRAAVPLLKLASEVEVLTIGEGEASPDEVAAYLDRHGCKVTARLLPKTGDVGTQLLDELNGSGARWCVMGSYGHSRLREQIFGGASRKLLAKAQVPVLISH
ncbi:universal stress protein [Sphingobium lignivorans]|uniref:Nucleotide-binding universal stress UspA family protein n=1 Tax=Sphingobium lignivorans TaxID=2735886 RepID=A0ABR6NKT2_9SPHN|nr:universal stress protein [Sphingobium lignivorans]MBB5987897.1 nucleotide-binding universal stress UspA family protein [Sphingobium lignivorans]